MASPAYSADTGSGERQRPPQLENWQKRVRTYHEAHDKRCKEWKDNREYSAGTKHDDGKGGLVRTNLIYANQSTIVPNVYAKNPEIAVSPSRSVSPATYRTVKQFAQTLDIVLSRMFIEDTQLKQRMRAALYSTYNTGEAWLKMIYQRDYASDPIIKSRIHDAQDNLRTLEWMLRRSKHVDDSRDTELAKAELLTMIEALEAQVEVVVAEGLVIDGIQSDDIMVLDRTLTFFDSYAQADAIDHMIWMTKEDYEQLTGVEWPKEGAPTIHHERKLQPDSTGATPGSVKDRETAELVCVHEIWQLKSNTVYTFAEGGCQWAREPYQPAKQPERWYPFYRLGWNFQDGSMNALPDVSLQKELQDEYNRTRTQWAEHRADSMPVRVVRGSGSLTQEDVDNIKNRKSRQIIVVSGKPGEPLGQDLGEIPGIPMDPSVYDTNPIRGDMEMVAGRGDAAAGGIVEAKTATEAQIQQAGLMGRSDFRRDVTEDVLKEMAKAAAEICLQELTVEQVQYLAGQDAVWPMMAKEQVFALVNIDIRAGSTSKPNQAKEREQWQMLLPVIEQTITKIFELQMAGQLQLADVLRKLLKETLRKYDERLDLEELLGPEGEEGQAQAQQMQAMQQQIGELSQALEQAQAQLQQADQQKLATEQAALEEKQFERSLREREMEERKAEREATKAEQAMRSQADEQKRAAESESKTSITREQWDREDQRAEAERTFRREQAALEQHVAALSQRIEQMQATQAMAGEEEGDDGVEEIKVDLQALQSKLDRIETERQRRTSVIAEYLKGPRTDDTLRATVNKLTGMPGEETD
jgi:hypothetical protein